MKRLPDSVLLLLSGLLFLLILTGLFHAFQIEKVYDKTLGKISYTERRIEGEIKSAKAPFLSVNAENLHHWDVVHYERIKNTGYKMDNMGSYYLFAFYPMFPYVWRLSGLDVRWMCLLNFILFFAGLLLLFNVYAKRNETKLTLLLFLSVLCLPSTVIFFLPYSEALFFFFVSLGIIAYLKDRFWFYFMMISFAAMTRRASFLLLGAAIAASVLLFITNRNKRQFAKDILELTTPVIAGTCAIALIQYFSGSGSLLSFIHVTGSFSQEFKIPEGIADWSHNSFPMNMGILFTFIPIVSISLFAGIIRPGKTNVSDGIVPIDHKKELIAVMSVCYFLAAVAFILFFQGGSLNSTFRGIMCTPFFVISLFYLRDLQLSKKFRLITFITFCLTGLVLFFTASYTSYPLRFSYLSLPLLLTCLGIWLFKTNNRFTKTDIVVYTILLLISTSLIGYLFDIFLGNGWIYT